MEPDITELELAAKAAAKAVNPVMNAAISAICATDRFYTRDQAKTILMESIKAALLAISYETALISANSIQAARDKMQVVIQEMEEEEEEEEA